MTGRQTQDAGRSEAHRGGQEAQNGKEAPVKLPGLQWSSEWGMGDLAVHLLRQAAIRLPSRSVVLFRSALLFQLRQKDRFLQDETSKQIFSNSPVGASWMPRRGNAGPFSSLSLISHETTSRIHDPYLVQWMLVTRHIAFGLPH